MGMFGGSIDEVRKRNKAYEDAAAKAIKDQRNYALSVEKAMETRRGHDLEMRRAAFDDVTTIIEKFHSGEIPRTEAALRLEAAQQHYGDYLPKNYRQSLFGEYVDADEAGAIAEASLPAKGPTFLNPDTKIGTEGFKQAKSFKAEDITRAVKLKSKLTGSVLNTKETLPYVKAGFSNEDKLKRARWWASSESGYLATLSEAYSHAYGQPIDLSQPGALDKVMNDDNVVGVALEMANKFNLEAPYLTDKDKKEFKDNLKNRVAAYRSGQKDHIERVNALTNFGMDQLKFFLSLGASDVNDPTVPKIDQDAVLWGMDYVSYLASQEDMTKAELNVRLSNKLAMMRQGDGSYDYGAYLKSLDNDGNMVGKPSPLWPEAVQKLFMNPIYTGFAYDPETHELIYRRPSGNVIFTLADAQRIAKKFDHMKDSEKMLFDDWGVVGEKTDAEIEMGAGETTELFEYSGREYMRKADGTVVDSHTLKTWTAKQWRARVASDKLTKKKQAKLRDTSRNFPTGGY